MLNLTKGYFTTTSTLIISLFGEMLYPTLMWLVATCRVTKHC